jgi:hypothetical protein
MIDVYRAAEQMMLFVPTRGRVDNQLTLRNLPTAWRERTSIVCPKEEVKKHLKNWPDVMNVIPQPDSNMTIAAKRAWIFREAGEKDVDKIMMLDDDLRFAVRRKTLDVFKGYAPEGSRGTSGNSRWARYFNKYPGIHKVVNVSGDENPKLARMFGSIEKMLTIYAHGGIATRLHNQEYGCEFTLNSRVQYALAYHVPTVLRNCELGRIGHREDFDYTLQLLRSGFENAVFVWGVVEQHEYGSAGGASLERKIAASNRDAFRLAELHPGIVKAAKREYKRSIPRVEVTVYWKKAIEEGKCEFL